MHAPALAAMAAHTPPRSSHPFARSTWEALQARTHAQPVRAAMSFLYPAYIMDEEMVRANERGEKLSSKGGKSNPQGIPFLSIHKADTRSGRHSFTASTGGMDAYGAARGCVLMPSR